MADTRDIVAFVEAHENHARTLQRSINNLNQEQRRLLLHLDVDVAVMAIPVARIARLTRTVRAIEVGLQAARGASFWQNVGTAITIVVGATGVYDAASNFLRLRNVPAEIRQIQSQLQSLQNQTRNIRQKLENLRNESSKRQCHLLGQLTPGR